MSPACSPRKKRLWVIRILCSIGGFLPSISVAAVIPCRTQVPPMIHHPFRCHPACSQKSINRANKSPQTHPQRTFLCIELEKSTYVVSSYAAWHIHLPIPLSVSNVGHCSTIPLISCTFCIDVLIILPDDRRYEDLILLQRIN
jgi:hypothetical protein